MITYEIREETGKKPRFVKAITVSASEVYDTEINTSMDNTELDAIPTQKILDFCDSLINYIKYVAKNNLRKIELTETRNDYPNRAWGWVEMEVAKREYDEWWSYAYYNRESQE